MCEVSSLPVTMEKSSKDYEGTPVCKSHPLAEPRRSFGPSCASRCLLQEHRPSDAEL